MIMNKKTLIVALSLITMSLSAMAQKAILVDEGGSLESSAFEGQSIVPLSSRIANKSAFRSVEDLKTAHKVGVGGSLNGLGLLNALLEVNVTYDQAVQVGVSAFSDTQLVLGAYRYSYLERNSIELYSIAGGGLLSGYGGGIPSSLPKSLWLDRSEIDSGRYSLLMMTASLGASYTFIDSDLPGLGLFAELNVLSPANNLKPMTSAHLGSIFYF